MIKIWTEFNARDDFSKKGIDIWNLRYGAWVDASAHRVWSSPYNKAWKEYIEHPHTIDDVFEYARKLGEMPRYGFKVLF